MPQITEDSLIDEAIKEIIDTDKEAKEGQLWLDLQVTIRYQAGRLIDKRTTVDTLKKIRPQ